MSEIPARPLLTRKGAVAYINEALGIPVTLSSFSKLAMHGKAPEPDGYYGKVQLYRPENIERWAESQLLSHGPKRLDLNGQESA